jgi:hypothetical protein
MSKPLGYYVSGSPAAAALAQEYGDQLQDMGLDEKLLAIKAISGALLDSLLHTDTEPSIERQILDHIDNGYAMDQELQEYLTAIDGRDERQCLSLLTALVAYANEEFQQFGEVA